MSWKFTADGEIKNLTIQRDAMDNFIGFGLDLTAHLNVTGGSSPPSPPPPPPPPAWNPSQLPDVVLAALFNLDTFNTLSDGSGSVPGVGDPIGRRVPQVGPNMEQATEANRPLYRADGMEADATNDLLTLASSVATGSGDVTIYLTGLMLNSGANWVPIGNTDGTSILKYTDGRVYVIKPGPAYDSGTYQPGGGNTGVYNLPTLVRLRRVSGAWKMRCTGFATEQDMNTDFGGGATGSMSYNQLFARPTDRNGNTSNRYRDYLIIPRLLTTEEQTDTEAWFAAEGYEF